MNGGFIVLNPGGGDPDQDFPHGAGVLDIGPHVPLNYHAYAACLKGGFRRDVAGVPDSTGAVLLLLRKRLKPALAAAENLKRRGIRFHVCWKESGRHQVADALAEAKNVERFRRIAELADGFLSSTPDMAPLYRGFGLERGGFVPTPYPLEEPAWDFSIPDADRQGVFVGTREFSVPSRNHLAAVLAAARAAEAAGTHATVICLNRNAEKMLEAVLKMHPALRYVRGELKFERYIQVIAAHRAVFQLDRSGVPGQVAGDALLCRVCCVGGDGAVECLANPAVNGRTRSDEELEAHVTHLLKNESALEQERDNIMARALETLSFSAVAGRLREILEL